MRQQLVFIITLFIVIWVGGSIHAAALPRSTQIAVHEAQKLMKEEGSYREAEKLLKDYLSKHPESNHVPVFFTLANIYSLQGNAAEAVPFYQRALKKDPEFSPAWQNLGSVLFDLKKYGQAGNAFEKAFATETLGKNGEKSFFLLYHASIAYLMAGKPALARPHLEYLTSGAVKEIKQEWIESLFKTYLDLEKNELAMQLILKLIAQDGENPKWWHFLAHLHLQKGKYEEAAEALTIRSYLKKPTRAETLLLADLYRMIGTPLKAAAAYKKVIGMDNSCRQKKCSGYYLKLAHSYLAGHKEDLALQALAKAIEIAPEAGLYKLKGQIMMSSEQWQKAYLAFTRATVLDAGNGRSHLLAGYSALQAGSYKEAREHLKKAVTFPKQSKTAGQLLNNIEILEMAQGDDYYE